MHTREPTDMVAHVRLTTPLQAPALAAPGAGSVDDLEALAVAAASSAALGVATQHWETTAATSPHTFVSRSVLSRTSNSDKLGLRGLPGESGSIRRSQRARPSGGPAVCKDAREPELDRHPVWTGRARWRSVAVTGLTPVRQLMYGRAATGVH
jgi:hypothetical protein